jgi:hypothetical protein
MLTLPETLLIGAATVLVLLMFLELVARVVHMSFLATVTLGQDNRTSTSKTLILVWTLLIGWALTSLLIAGQIINTHSCVTTKIPIKECTAQGDQVGLMQIGWHNFLASGMSATCLVLLGIPAAAGVAAKAITQRKVEAGTLVKTPAPGMQSAVTRIAQVLSTDDQTADIGDFQYVVFSFIMAVYFVIQFVKPSAQGLPVIPSTLLGLTSISAAFYIGKKAATRNQPRITGVFPSILRANTTITIVGNGLTADQTQPRLSEFLTKPQVTINGEHVPTEHVKADQTVANRLTAIVPPDLGSAGEQTLGLGTIQVLTARGNITPSFSVQMAIPTGEATTATPPGSRLRWWSYPSLWLWGLVVLLVIAVPQLLLTPPTFTASGFKPSRVYTQAMIASREFIGAELRGARLAHLDLRGKDFQGADAADADFSLSDLRGADLRNACLRTADLMGAELAGTDFTGADVTGVTVTSSAITKAIGWSSFSFSSACSRR